MTYDERERYVVPIGEKGCEFDCSLHREGGKVHIPLAVQANSYWGWGKGDSLEAFTRFIEHHWDDIETEGFARLCENYKRFGSTMYGWETQMRLRNIIQELADARAYLSSGDV